jgi:hypothetical protein
MFTLRRLAVTTIPRAARSLDLVCWAWPVLAHSAAETATASIEPLQPGLVRWSGGSTSDIVIRGVVIPLIRFPLTRVPQDLIIRSHYIKYA